MTALFILFLFLGVGLEVGFSLAMAGFVGLTLGWGSDVAMGYLNTTPFRYAASFSLAMIPLFMLMGTYSSEGGIATMLFNTAQKWLGNVRGGMAMAVMVACAIFSAASGSSSACAATFTPICYPQMLRLKYDKALSLGAIAVAGTLDIMIPPSITLVFYGLLTGTSIAKLYIAGIIPGIILTLSYSLTVWILVKRNPALAPEVSRSTWRERVVSLKDTWAIITLIVLCLGTLYVGIVTPTEAAALGAAGALIIGLVWALWHLPLFMMAGTSQYELEIPFFGFLGPLDRRAFKEPAELITFEKFRQGQGIRLGHADRIPIDLKRHVRADRR